MNILFVCPTWTDDLGVFSRLARKRNSQPPLGILYLASVAHKRGHHVDVIDADVEDFTLKSLANHVVKKNYDVVGITSTSPIFHKAVALAKEIKDRNGTATVLIGGEHMNIFKKEAFYDCFDFGFFGESDYTFDTFLSIIEKNSDDFTGMKGFIYRKNGNVIETEPSEKIKNLDELALPSMHLLKLDKYVMSFAKFRKRLYLPIMASRGCPFKCVYCSEPLTNPVIRFRSPENIVDEMEKWKQELNISHFFFMDSNLTLKRPQIEGICEEIIRRNLNITFEGWTRANLIDKEILLLMKRAGLIRISYGLESGDPRVLKIIRKEVSHEDMLTAFRLTEEAGIEPACSVMLGLPGDTRESVERTIEFVRKIPQILYSNFSIANPYPGTEMFKWSQDGTHGIKLLIKDFSEYRRYDHSPISVNDLGPDDLVRLQKIGLLKIHFTPKRILAAIKMVGLRESLSMFLNFLEEAIKTKPKGVKEKR
ncbi:MAG: radical SAM protein [Nitrospirae bacterium]|nr:radical SAM protein [Nitrospirota bacterium]